MFYKKGLILRPFLLLNCAPMYDKTTNLFEQALACLLLDDPQQKVDAVLSLQADWLAGKLDLNPLSDVMS